MRTLIISLLLIMSVIGLLLSCNQDPSHPANINAIVEDRNALSKQYFDLLKEKMNVEKEKQVAQIERDTLKAKLERCQNGGLTLETHARVYGTQQYSSQQEKDLRNELDKMVIRKTDSLLQNKTFYGTQPTQ